MPSRESLLQLVVLGVCAAILPPIAHAQRAVRIPESPACGTCKLTLQGPLVLGRREGEGRLAGRALSLASDGKGELWLSSMELDHRTLVFSRSGAFQRVVVQQSSVATATLVRGGRGDTAYVLDPLRSIVHVVRANGEEVGRVSLVRTKVFDFDVAGDGTFILSGMVPTRDLVGIPLHLYTPEGTYKTSATSGPAVVAGSQQLGLDLTVVRSLKYPKSFWTTNGFRPLVQRWSTDGVLEEEIFLERSWFPEPSEVRAYVNSDKPPQPRLVTMSEDAAGRLWLAYWIPNPAWKSAVHESTPHEREQIERLPQFYLTNADDYLDSVIEVIDLKTMRLLAQTRERRLLPYFAGPGLLGELSAENASNPVQRIWRLNILTR